MKRRITIRKVPNAQGYYFVTGGGNQMKVASKAHALEIAKARQRLRKKGRC